MAERKHTAVGAVGHFDSASSKQALRCEDPFIIAPKLPHRLARQGASAQSLHVLLGHLHRGHDIGSGLLRINSLGIDEIRVFEATCTAANSLLAAVRGARVHHQGSEVALVDDSIVRVLLGCPLVLPKLEVQGRKLVT